MTEYRDVFLHQASQADGRSPLYARLLRELADDPRVGEIVESPARWDAALRLMGGLHYLVLTGRASWERVGDALVDERAFLRRFVAEQGVQTNEVQRCWTLLPCFLELSRRTGWDTFDLVEFGPSAGLLLYWDRYRYGYESGSWGDAEAPLELHGEERRAVPAELLAVQPAVRSRVGIDLAPVDVTNEEGALVLKSFVWATDERIERLDRAIDVLRRDPPALVQGDVLDLLPEHLERRSEEALTVVMQIASAGYLNDDGRERLRRIYADAGRTAPLAVVATTQALDKVDQYWGLRISYWPEGESEVVAHADFHGSWLEWLA